MIRILVFALLIYMGYKLLFDFIIPVYKTTKQVKKGFTEMKNKMNEHANQQKGADKNKAESAAPKQPVGDYIDFEDIK